MRAWERGFTLVEMVVAVAILTILVAAGGVWMLATHPGALRAAADDFDADLASARAVAASSGNGATIVFAPRTDPSGNPSPGFQLRVYSGRPTAAGAVQPTSSMPIVSDAVVSEKTFGSPPFAIFLSSAGYPTGVASYPTIANDGSATFAPIAQQPPCPAGGIVLTFSNAQGAKDTRTLACGASVLGSATAANPSPTPNAPILTPKSMVAHWTSDAASLQFVATEFGYTHWFASSTGMQCGSVATYPAGSPYSQPYTTSEGNLAPSAPAGAAYSYPNASGGSMNDAPAAFRLSPIPATPGFCTPDIVDDYGQHAQASVQIMGDLTASTTTVTFASPTAAAQTITVGKVYDSEQLQLHEGGNCGSIVTWNAGTPSTPPTPLPTQAATIALTIAPNGAGQSGTCTLLVGDQYNEPTVSIAVTIQKPIQPLTVVPAAIEFPTTSGTTIPYPALPIAYVSDTLDVRVAQMINRALGGGIADAGAGPPVGTACAALAFKDTGFSTLDGSDDGALGTQGGCFSASGLASLGLGAAESDVQANEPGFQGTFTTVMGSCFPYLTQNGTTGSGATQHLGFSSSSGSAGSCTFNIADSSAQQKSVAASLILTVEVVESTTGGCKTMISGIVVCKYDVKAMVPGNVFCMAQVLNVASSGPEGDPSVGLFGDGNGNADGYIVPPATQAGWASLLEALTGATSAITSGCPL